MKRLLKVIIIVVFLLLAHIIACAGEEDFPRVFNTNVRYATIKCNI